MELPNKYTTCPNCGYKLDGATPVTDENAIPKEGDLGVCFNCGTLLEYEEGFFVHELPESTLESIKLLDVDTYIRLKFTQNTIKEFRKSQPKTDPKCVGCIYLVKPNNCELDTDDDSPCFHYDHYTSNI